MSGALEDIDTVLAETGEPRLTSMALENNAAVETGMSYAEGISAYQLWQLHKKRIALREEYLAAWQASASATGTGRPVDGVIGPVAPYAAPPHGKATLVSRYTSIIPVQRTNGCQKHRSIHCGLEHAQLPLLCFPGYHCRPLARHLAAPRHVPGRARQAESRSLCVDDL